MNRREIACWWNGLKVGFATGTIIIALLAVFGADGIHVARNAVGLTRPALASTSDGWLAPEFCRPDYLTGAERDEIGDAIRGLK